MMRNSLQKAIEAVRWSVNQLVVLPIRIYKVTLSPLLLTACVFEPTCSEYTKQAILKYGPIKGIFLGVRRISRCHPWQTERFDPLE